MAPVKDQEWMEAVVVEALLAKAERQNSNCFKFELLCQWPKALNLRLGLGVKWGEYMIDEGRSLRALNA